VDKNNQAHHPEKLATSSKKKPGTKVPINSKLLDDKYWAF
jgi:hypothetical protein